MEPLLQIRRKYERSEQTISYLHEFPERYIVGDGRANRIEMLEIDEKGANERIF